MILSTLLTVVVLVVVNGGAAKTPNVLFVVVDDLKPNLGLYGYRNGFTPNFDALANRSFVFNNAFAQQALCAPSRNSFLTSRRPDSLHLYDFYSYWRDTVGNFTTLPQHFKNNGYYAHSIGKIFHPGVSSNFSDDTPYSWSAPPYHPPTEAFKEAKVCVNDDGSLGRNLVCPVVVDEQPGGSLPDLQSLNAALDFLKYSNKITDNRPYFLAVGFHKPHIPLKYPVEYLEKHPLEDVILPVNKFRPSLLPTVAWNPWTDVRERDDIAALNISFPFGTMPDSVTKKIIQSYDAAVSYIDDLFGQLLKKIDNSTIVVVTSDHGWSLGQHGEFAKYSNFDEATRVPLIIHVPGLGANKITINTPVELVDLFPTLVDLTQVSDSLQTCNENKTNWDLCTEGKSLVSLMYKASSEKNQYLCETVAFTQYPRPSPYPTLKPNSDKPRLKEIKIMGYSIRTARCRYTEWVEFNNTSCTPVWSKRTAAELYDHLLDPEENSNLFLTPDLDFIKTELRRRLKLGWRYANLECSI